MRTFDSDFEKNLYHDRLQTLEKIADLGQQLGLSRADAKYPNRFPSHGTADTIPAIRATYGHAPAEEFELAAAEGKPIQVTVAGRIMAIRLQGKAGFAQLQGGGWERSAGDGGIHPTPESERLQIYVRKDDVGEAAFALYKLLDLGDYIGVRGTLMRTRTGELTLKAMPLGEEPALTFLTKAMLALPDKYHGLEDVELRYRQRYVDLIVNSGTLAKAETFPAALPAPQPGPATAADFPAASPGSSPALTPLLSSDPAAALGETGESMGHLAIPSQLPPGASAVTDTAAPNEEHNDAPRSVREVFVKRAAILRSIRRFFDDRGFLEVETPMMHTVAGGAAARPFKTHHNALDIDLSLRIAPELFLKRLVVGGLDRVYEINRNFRNEGVSTQHNPEFTMLEFYQAYANYHDLMDLTEELVTKVATEVNGSPITHFNGQEIDLSKWRKLTMVGAIRDFWPAGLGAPPESEIFSNSHDLASYLRAAGAKAIQENMDAVWDAPVSDTVSPRELANYHGGVFLRLGKRLDSGESLGKIIADLFEHLGESPFAKNLIQPTIIYDFPLAVSPLSKQKPDDPNWVERFEFYIGGFEVGNAFSELNDPEEQRKRFEQQLAEHRSGDKEAMAEMDEDYVRALGYGLPPTAGEGIGIDRLTMLLTGSRSIRDVILFPLLRPQKSETPKSEGSPLKADA